MFGVTATLEIAVVAVVTVTAVVVVVIAEAVVVAANSFVSAASLGTNGGGGTLVVPALPFVVFVEELFVFDDELEELFLEELFLVDVGVDVAFVTVLCDISALAFDDDDAEAEEEL